MTAAVTADDLIEFVYDEAALIDQKRLDEWLDLFAEDGLFWMPLTPDQPEGDLHTSLYHDDKLLLKLRVERLKSPRAYAQHPPSRCHHLLQRPKVLEMDDAANRYVVRTAFHYVETRGDEQFLLAGWVTHTLAREGGALRIKRRKVDLLNCDAALPSIQLIP